MVINMDASCNHDCFLCDYFARSFIDGKTYCTRGSKPIRIDESKVYGSEIIILSGKVESKGVNHG